MKYSDFLAISQKSNVIGVIYDVADSSSWDNGSSKLLPIFL